MAEPSASKGTEETGVEALASETRFEHAPTGIPTVEASEAAADEPAAEAPAVVAAPAPAPAPASAPAATGSGLAGLADHRPPAGTPEWPVAWLRLVEPEPPAPEASVAAVIAAEPADADGVAHAFGQAMAAALDPHLADEPEPAASETHSEPEAEPELAAAGEPSAAAEAADAAKPSDPHGLHTIHFSALAMEAEPPEYLETSRAAGRVFGPRDVSGRKSRTDRETADRRAGEGVPAMAVYVLYLASFVVAPAVLGLVIALNARRTAPDWLESHYVFQIRTFWIGLCVAAIGAALLLSGVLTLPGLILGLLLIVWMVARSAVGFICVAKLQSYPRPRAWLI